MYTLSQILVPVDFSPPSRAALDYVAFLAQQFGSRVDVLHVWQPPHIMWTPDSPFLPDGQLALFERSAAGQAMKELLAQLEEETGIRCRGRLESGDPVTAILQVAEEEHYDLIVMGTRGRTGMSHLLLRSKASSVVRRASCPVLTVHAPEAEKGSARALQQHLEEGNGSIH